MLLKWLFLGLPIAETLTHWQWPSHFRNVKHILRYMYQIWLALTSV